MITLRVLRVPNGWSCGKVIFEFTVLGGAYIQLSLIVLVMQFSRMFNNVQSFVTPSKRISAGFTLIVMQFQMQKKSIRSDLFEHRKTNVGRRLPRYLL
jgi:hypothetical protein